MEHTVNGFGLGTYLKKWLKGEFQTVDVLAIKFHDACKQGASLTGFENNFSIINLVDYSFVSNDLKEYKKTGLVFELVGTYVEKILEENVLPLLERCKTGGPQSSSSYLQETRSAHMRANNKEPIAIVGMSCRYPGSNNLEEFWELLFRGEDATCTPPPFRWVREQCTTHRADERKTNAGFLNCPVDEFDARFFGISPKEALFMDPQHRLLHEVVWEGLEDASINPNSLRGTNGSVFLGLWRHEYEDIVMNSTVAEFYRGYMGNSFGSAAARISFLLGMTGPSISTDSACSASMVAVHLACKSLRNGETNLALAGGVNIILHPFEHSDMPLIFSRDGHSKTFSEDANGFARAEGCGVLVLKRLSDALNDGDNIWAVIRGTGIAQEGNSKSMGTPTVDTESAAMQEALYDGGVRPEQVSYVEAHGTGTVVGDPMEVASISKAYRSSQRKEPLIIGSVKTNVGHTESCSGITGIMKVVLAMGHETIPPHINFSKLNPSIKLDVVPAVIPLQPLEWKKETGKSRMAGVSSFGITGTDAHVILEEPPQVSVAKSLTVNCKMERPLHILKISAKTEEALDILLKKMERYIEASEEPLSDIAYSLNCGRADFSNRVAIIAKSKEDVVGCIREGSYLKEEFSGEYIPKICFLFTGQGSQYPGMAKQLYDCSPVFRIHFDYCDSILKSEYNIDFKPALWSNGDSKSQDEMSRTINSQTSIFCVEYALLKLWESWGVKPDAVLGHSLGEFAAAVCAGIISVEDAIMLVAQRSRLIDKLPRGKMLVVQADFEQVQENMKRFFNVRNGTESLDVAAINSRQQTVVAGDSDVIMEFSKFLTQLKLKCIVLAATHAFHSKHMDPMLDNYRKIAQTVRKPINVHQSCEFISGVEGDLVTGAEIDAEYWVRHTREKVNFLNASKKAVELGCDMFVEIGSQPVLSALTMMNNSESRLLCLPSVKRNSDGWDTILATLGKLYVKGVQIDWKGLDEFYAQKKVRLPHYPFIGKKLWPDLIQVAGNITHPLVGTPIPNVSSTKLFQSGINLRSFEYIKDHIIGNTVIFPGAAYLEMSLAAGLATVQGSVDSLGKPSRGMKVENLVIKAPLALQDSSTVKLQIAAELENVPSQGHENGWNEITVKIFQRQESDSSSKWLEHTSAKFSGILTPDEQRGVEFDKEDFFERLAKPHDSQSTLKYYQKLASVGLNFGPAFRSIEYLSENEDQDTLLAKVKFPLGYNNNGQSAEYIVHPLLFDAMLQAMMMKKMSKNTKVKLCVPIKIGKLVWFSNGEGEERYIQVLEDPGRNNNGPFSTYNLMALLLDSNATILAVMSQVEFVDTTVKAIEAVLQQHKSKMPDLWEEIWYPQVGSSQFRHDLSPYTKPNFIDTKLKEDLHQKFNIFSAELGQNIFGLEQMVYLNYIRCLYECGWKPALGDLFTEAELLNKLNILPTYTRLFSHILTILEEEHILKRTGKCSWQVVQVPSSMSQIQNQLSSSPFSDEFLKRFNSAPIFQNAGDSYSEILKGGKTALSVLFPKKGPSLNTYYKDHAEVFNITGVVSSVVPQHLRHLKSQCTTNERKILRVLEIGGGTGSLTKTFVEIMVKEGVEFEYTFTDISPFFFPAAQKLLEEHLQHVKFRKLNIEEDPISQGFIPFYYDWIVAGDVIHATKDVKESLANVRMLLRNGGKFEMVEQIKVSRFITYLFGLLDGFWRFEDLELRPNHCTLSNEKWIETLQNCGFQHVGSFPTLNNTLAYISTHKKCSELNEIKGLGYRLSEGKCLSRQKLWILFHSDNSPVSNSLLSLISTLDNRQIVVVRRGVKFNQVKTNDEWRFELDQQFENDFCLLMDCLQSCSEQTIEGIVWCWSLDKTCEAQEVVLKPYFHMIKSVLKLKQSQSPKITALLNGVVPIDGNDLSHLHPSTIWGFNKVLLNERIELRVRSVDIGADEDEKGVKEQAFFELWDNEDDKVAPVAYHENTRYLPKIKSVKPSFSELKLPIGSDSFQLILPETRAIEDLRFGPLDSMGFLKETEVEVQIKASSLNFRDVFSVLKPSDAFKNLNSVGLDFAGVVKRVGSNVTKWIVGDHVFGVNINNYALPSHLKLNENDLSPVPKYMTLPDACTLPTVYATSYYCLVEVANITPQDIVLIHTASGGVGLSAIELCKSVGAKVIATAGSKRKQNYLKSLGIEHVFHSRNTNYCDEILRVTNGLGVNVVLNSLTSDGFKEATLKACAQGARFVEMSKLSIWQPEQVKILRPDVQYTVADLSKMSRSEWNELMGDLVQLITKNVAKPIPYVRFDAVHIREALQYLQKAKHIGKVVCVMPEIRQRHSGGPQVFTPMFNTNATYLITGGLGGIGYVVCQWMVDKGAKHVLLAGRNSPSELLQQSIDKLNSEYKANVKAVQLDVSDFSQCKYLVQNKISEIGFPAFRGVMHAAGTLRDGLIENQTWESLSSPFNSKVAGTLNLHELTKDLNLEFFVLFSSTAAVIGPPGQPNHCAGNMFEDAFTHYRQSMGLPATTVNWGQWSELGIATEFDLQGFKPLTNAHGITALEYVLMSQRTQTMAINIESFATMAKLYPYSASMFDERLLSKGSSSLGSQSNVNLNFDYFWQQYDSMQDSDSRTKFMRFVLRSVLQTTLKSDKSEIFDDTCNFEEMGVDSLMFVEIKNSIQHLLGHRAVISSNIFRECNNVVQLAITLSNIIEGGDFEEKTPTVDEVIQLIREDIQLPEHITSKPGQKRVEVKDIETVLLTGCTGTLGVYILRELTKISQVKKVICLMQPKKHISVEDRLANILEKREILSEINMEKVTCVRGNVAEFQFGMESSLWLKLCNDVDAVIHCAAKVQHLEIYRKRDTSTHDARAVNIGGLKNVLEFACSGDKLKHVNCASSMACINRVENDGSVNEDWLEPNDFDGVTNWAYPITKFVENMLMKEAIQSRGIPGKVFRLPLVMGDSKDGRFLLESNHLMLRYLFILKTGIMQSNPAPLPMLSVDICAWALVQLSFNSSAPNEVFNVCNKYPDSDQDFVFIAKKLGFHVDLVALSEFNKRVRESVAKKSSFAVFADFYRQDDTMLSLYTNCKVIKEFELNGVKDENFMVSKKIRKVLPEFYSESNCARDEIYRDLLYAKKQGWFEKHGIIEKNA